MSGGPEYEHTSSDGWDFGLEEANGKLLSIREDMAEMPMFTHIYASPKRVVRVPKEILPIPNSLKI